MPYVNPVRIPTATFPSHIPNACYTDASTQSVSSNLKPTSTHKLSLSSYQKNVSPKPFTTLITSYQEKYAPTSTITSPYSSEQENVSSPPVTMHSISSRKTNVRAASVLCSILPSKTMDSPVNSLNSSYVVKTKPFYFKTTKYLV